MLQNFEAPKNGWEGYEDGSCWSGNGQVVTLGVRLPCLPETPIPSCRWSLLGSQERTPRLTASHPRPPARPSGDCPGAPLSGCIKDFTQPSPLPEEKVQLRALLPSADAARGVCEEGRPGCISRALRSGRIRGCVGSAAAGFPLRPKALGRQLSRALVGPPQRRLVGLKAGSHLHPTSVALGKGLCLQHSGGIAEPPEIRFCSVR